jgi:hypothetical protein
MAQIYRFLKIRYRNSNIIKNSCQHNKSVFSKTNDPIPYCRRTRLAFSRTKFKKLIDFKKKVWRNILHHGEITPCLIFAENILLNRAGKGWGNIQRTVLIGFTVIVGRYQARPEVGLC